MTDGLDTIIEIVQHIQKNNAQILALLKELAKQNDLLHDIAAEVFADPMDGGHSRLSPGIEKRLKEILEK